MRYTQRGGKGTRELTCLLRTMKRQSHTSRHGNTDNKAGRDPLDHSASSLHQCRAVRTDGQSSSVSQPVGELGEIHPAHQGFAFYWEEDPPALQPAHCPPGETRELRHKTRTSGFYFWLCCWQFTTFLHFPICYLGIMQYC